MAVQKYDIRRSQEEGGGFEERYWSPVNSPVLGPDNELAYIIHRVEDVTEFVRSKQRGNQHNEITEELRRRADRMEAEVYLRSQDLQNVNNRLRQAIDALHAEIAERTQAEEQIDRLNKKLQCRVAELAAVNAELESFCYSVSHDLRAPLRGIDGFSRALLEEFGKDLDPEALQYLHYVREDALRMGQLIDDLLGLSRLTRSKLTFAPVDLSALAETVAKELRRREPARSVTVFIEEGLMAQGDARLLRGALENLLGNAWKFTSQREDAKIEFGITRHNGQAAYFVRDNGAGFDMQYVGKLFGAFQRLHRTSEFAGNGIGLASVQRIIQRHGGRVWAEGAVGQGATFYFNLSPAEQPS
jgi:signal transduction histidine kinase